VNANRGLFDRIRWNNVVRATALAAIAIVGIVVVRGSEPQAPPLPADVGVDPAAGARPLEPRRPKARSTPARPRPLEQRQTGAKRRHRKPRRADRPRRRRRATPVAPPSNVNVAPPSASDVPYSSEFAP
jgi:hypothetical protein